MEPIKVVVRIRPNENDDTCISFDRAIDIKNSLRLSSKKVNGNTDSFDFTFDKVFHSGQSQEDVFNHVRQLIDECLNGFSVTIFAFGMTGSGKTHTIAGVPSNPGIVPRAVNYIFSNLQKTSRESRDSVAMVFLTYVELYNNGLYDLLANDLPLGEENVGLKLYEHPKKGVIITGSPSIRTPVASAEEALQLIIKGSKLRATAVTNLNERSSRSHTVISFEIVSQDGLSSSEKIGKINFVDLAGSERVKLSGAEGIIFDETKQINLALSVLGDVLNSLSKYHQNLASTNGKSGNLSTPNNINKFIRRDCNNLKSTETVNTPHIPYRNSKLTMLLKDSLGGSAKTMMITTIRAESAFYPQTLISLRYASRARHIKCTPIQHITSSGEGLETGSSNSVRRTFTEVGLYVFVMNC